MHSSSPLTVSSPSKNAVSQPVISDCINVLHFIDAFTDYVEYRNVSSVSYDVLCSRVRAVLMFSAAYTAQLRMHLQQSTSSSDFQRMFIFYMICIFYIF